MILMPSWIGVLPFLLRILEEPIAYIKKVGISEVELAVIYKNGANGKKSLKCLPKVMIGNMASL